MTAVRADILIVGSSLSGLVCGTYLARAGLRVVLLEEETLSKRAPLLREPFVLSGLEAGAPVQRVLRELALPLIEQRKVEREPIAVQVILPEARVDVRAGRAELARELAAYGLCEAEAAESWLERADERGAVSAQRLWDASTPQPSASNALRRLLESSEPETPREPALPDPPGRTAPVFDALLGALGHRAQPGAVDAPAYLLRSLREGGFFMPSAGEPFADLFRRRLLALHGEIRAVERFGLGIDRGEIQLALPRGQMHARALVLAAPRELVRQAASTGGETPRWIRPATRPVELPQRLFRAEADDLPVGLSRRAVIVPPAPRSPYWLARHVDPGDANVHWLVFSGAGARELPASNPLVDLSPFPAAGITAVDPGPGPVWDRDASDLRFPDARQPTQLRTRPFVMAVGAEISPGLGLEAEILHARHVALRLIDRLGARRALS